MLTLFVCLQKLPKIKCKGHLDAVKVRMSDLKIQNLFKILDSIPKPDSLTSSQVPTRASVVAFDDDWIDVDGLAAVTQFVTGNSMGIICGIFQIKTGVRKACVKLDMWITEAITTS